jgi:hypothetical protein
VILWWLFLNPIRQPILAKGFTTVISYDEMILT